jgi:hypothetical protein
MQHEMEREVVKTGDRKQKRHTQRKDKEGVPGTVKSNLGRNNHQFSSLVKARRVSLGWAVPWLRQLVANLPPRRPKLVCVGFVVDKVAM